MELCHKNVYISVHAQSICKCLFINRCLRVCYVCTTLPFYSLCVAVLFSAFVPMYLVVLHLRIRPSVCQCLSVAPAARLWTCCCAICASSWCLAGIILFSVLTHAARVCSLHPPPVCIVLSSHSAYLQLTDDKMTRRCLNQWSLQSYISGSTIIHIRINVLLFSSIMRKCQHFIRTYKLLLAS